MSKPIVFDSPMDLPVAADHAKSPIRKQEFDQHRNAELHIQNDGLPGQMLVMTAFGPRMMTPKLQCKCGDSHYGCDCRIVFDDHPPQPDADVVIRCLKNGVTPVPDEGATHNNPAWTLEYDTANTFFRFVPDKVFDCNLSQLNWHVIDNVAYTLSGTHQTIDGKRCFDLYWDSVSAGSGPFTDYLIAWSGSTQTGYMPIRIRKG